MILAGTALTRSVLFPIIGSSGAPFSLIAPVFRDRVIPSPSVGRLKRLFRLISPRHEATLQLQVETLLHFNTLYKGADELVSQEWAASRVRFNDGVSSSFDQAKECLASRPRVSFDRESIVERPGLMRKRVCSSHLRKAIVSWSDAKREGQ